MASLLVIAAFAVVALYSLPDPASAQFQHGANQAPVIAALPTDLAIAENATGNVGSAFTATDGDGDTITWSVGGADGDEFSMDSASGQLSVTTGLDYTGLNYEDGATRSLTVTASDGNGGTDSEAVTVTVTDVREPPGRPAAPRVAVDANSPTTSIVTWKAPTNTGPPITRYYIRYCLDSTGCNQNSEWSDYPSTADTTVTIANLREGETHSVRVRAKNNEGQSPWSAIGTSAAVTASTTGTTIDYDADDDGLIEISSVAQLNAVRWDLDGDGTAETTNTSSYAAAFLDAVSGMGCPSGGCKGYELAADLDFDTNGSGGADSGDTYWNGGLGWVAIGPTTDTAFAAIFDGNRHSISNLFIGGAGGGVGLFNVIKSGAEVRYLDLLNVDITTAGLPGGLASANYGTVTGVYVEGAVTSELFNPSGMLLSSNGGRVIASRSSGSITGNVAGGLVGEIGASGSVVASYSNASVALPGAAGPLTALGGLAGRLTSGGTVTNSYWDSTTGLSSQRKNDEDVDDIGVGKTTSELQTPTGYTGIYADWDNLDLDGDSTTTDANFLWDFGSASEYPIRAANTAPKIVSTLGGFPFGPNQSFDLNEDKVDRTTESVVKMKGKDAEGDTFTWALSGSDASSFNLGDTASNRTVKVYVNETTVLDFESGKIVYSLTITATDEYSAASSLDFIIEVIDVAEVPPFKPHKAPTVTGKYTRLTVTWSAPASSGSAISGYNLQYREKDATWASHPHSGTTTTATIGSLTASTAYEVQVRGINAAGAGPWSDSGTGTTSAPNSAPVFTDGATTTRSVAENTAVTQNIGDAVAATDADAADTLTYTLGGTDAASFGIVSTSGQLQTKNALDYENKNSYTVTVSVSDSKNADGAADTAVDASTTVTISVTNMDDAGSVSFDSTTATVGTALAASLTDPDGSVSSTAWKWASSSDWVPATSTGTWDDISGATSASYTPAVGDLGSYLRATASYTDAIGSGKTAARVTSSAVAAAAPPNSAPVFTDGATTTRSVAENTAVTQNIGDAVAATDADAADTLTYTLGGTDAASFGIVSSSGQLQTKAALDYETKTSYTVTVSVSDSKDAAGNADTAVDATITVTISVSNVDEAGSVSFDAGSVSFDPGTATADTSLAVTLADPDGSVSGTTWQWASSSDGDPAGTWDDISGATSASYTPVAGDVGKYLQATASYTDGHGSGKTAVGVTASAVSLSASLTIDVYDVTPGGAEFGAPVTATDPDGGAITYSLGGTDASSFTIDSTTGQLSLHADTTLDAATYSITVTATDPEPETATVDVTVNVETCGGVWCGTMTAGFSSPNMGYSAPSNGTLLPSPVFEYGGTTYTVTRVARITQTDGGTGTERFEFKLNPDTNNVDLEELVLEYGHAAQSYSDTFALADTFERTNPGDPYEWTFSLIWDQGSADNSEIGTVHELKLVEKESIDYDVDDDGLIDINSIPQLSAIEFDPDGDGEVGTPDQTKYDAAFPYALAGMGCPAVCTGYELNNNLSFGTTDWNGADEGKWTPLTKAGYTATFEGNGKTLSDLNIFGGAGSVGLFGKLSSSGIIRNVGLEAPVIFNMAKTSPASIGALAGRNEGSIIASYARDGEVRSLFWISGGLVGKNASGGSITASYADMDVVDAHSGAGGLVGENYGTITASYAVTERLAGAYSGGLITTIGSINGFGSGTVTNSYWDTTASRETVSGAGVGKTRTELKAPTGYTGIYADWDDLNGDGSTDTETLWQFGAANTYPRLKWETNVDTTRGVVLSGQTLTVTEASGAGNTATYTVKLATQPAGGVTVRVASRDTSLVTASPPTLTFTSTNYNTAQTVTVTGVDNILTGANATVIITNTASGGGYDDQVGDVMVTLTDDSDSNNAPSITSTVQTLHVAENTTGDIGQFHATDLEGDSISWSLGGTDAALFRINANEWVWVPEVFDYENDPTTYSITVKASDATGSSSPLAVTVEVTDAKEPPLAPTNMVADGFADTKIMVKWTAPYDDATGRPPVTSYEIRYWRWGYAFPIEPNITGITGLTYAITGLRWETHYSVQVRARSADGKGRWSAEDVGATLEEGKLVNFAPTITGFPTGLTIDENATGDIGTPFVGFDYEDDTLTWSVDTPNNQLPADQLFAISQTGQLSVVAPGLDYEEGGTRSVTVRVTSNVSSSAIKTVEVTVNDVDETPSAPTGLTLDSAAIDSLTLSWTEPANTGPPVTGYTVCVRWQSFWVCKDTTSTTFTYESLPGNTEFDVRVQAESDEGRGAWSEISKFSTSE